MNLARYFVLASAIAALSAPPAEVAAQTFTLDPMSSSLPAIPATAGDVLAPGGLTIPTGGPPVVGISGASFGLLPGDVIDAISNPDDNSIQLQGILVDVDESYTHCPRALKFAELWNIDNIKDWQTANSRRSA